MKKIRLTLLILISFSLFLTACVPSSDSNENGIADTSVAEIVEEMMTSEAQKALETEQAAVTPTVAPTEKPTEPATSTPVPPTATVEPTATPEIKAIGPDNFPVDVNPLTGLKVEDPEIMNRMPVLVKVPNYPAYGRPHGGLSAADIVFESWIGGGANRFMALYYGQDSDYVWPIRSVRIMDPEVATLYSGILVFSGGDVNKVLPKVIETLGNKYVMEGTTSGMFDNGRGDVTRLYVDTELITRDVQNRGIDPGEKPNLDGMVFNEIAPEGGQEASKVRFYINSGNIGDWVYDEESGKYLRWIEDANTFEMIPLLDRNTNEQLAFSNFIMLYTPNIEIETQLIDIKIWDNVNGRRAVIFRDGKAYEAIWKTPDRKSPIRFYDLDGNLFELKPGNT